MINDQVKLANASRAMKESELEQANSNGVDPFKVVIAMDGLAVITNENIEIDELTIQEIGAIFKGEITNWQEVGGPDAEISLYGRQSNSGTFVYFRDNVLQANFSANVRRMNGNAQIVEGVKNDKYGIGYAGIGYVTEGQEVVSGLNVLSIASEPGIEAASPLKPANVKAGDYPLARPLYNYINGQPEGEVLDFLEFALSDTGQEIVVDIGFYPVSPKYRELNQQQLPEIY